MEHDFGTPAPIFRVREVRPSLAYYTGALGFSVDWDEGGIASVSRGRCTIFLCEWDQGRRGTWAWIAVRDLDALHEELVGRGARIRHPPTNHPWAREMQVEDLDANVLRLGADPDEGAPYGQFLDAKGVLWDTAPT